MPRRREKFVEITKTVTVTEIVNGAPDKHPSSCEVKVTNVSPAGPHPVNVSIKHLHEKWHSCEELNGRDLGKGTVIHIHETHKPFNYQKKPDRFVYEDVVNNKVESEAKARPPPPRDHPLFNRSSDNVIDLEFRHPVLVETTNGSSRRRFADLRKRVSTTTKTSMTETEKVTTTRRSSSAHSTSSRRSYGKPEVHTLYYRKFVDEDHEDHQKDDSGSDSGSVIIHRNSVTRRSRSAGPLRESPVASPVAPPRKRLGREESLHYYRDDEEVLEQNQQSQRRVTVKSPDDEYRKGNTSVSMNDTFERQNLTAGITSISMNNSCTDTSFESRFSTIPRARSSPPGSQRINHIHVNVIGPTRTPEAERKHPVVGRVVEDVTMDIFIERRHQRSASGSRRGSASAGTEAPPKPPRRSKYEEHHHIGEPLATSTPMTTIERKQTREERISVESGQSSRKSTRSTRPPDINIIECEDILRETRSPARTPATPIVVINQTPSSRRSSQDLLGDPGQRRRKSTVTDIDWYAAFNMKDPSSPTKLVRPPFAQDERKSSRDSRDFRRRASDSSMIGIPPADIDLNQIFTCTNLQIKKDEKCQCNACRLIRMSEAERASRMVRESRTRQSRSYQRVSDFESRSNTLPSRHRTSPVEIRLEDVFNPKLTSKPPTPPNRLRPPTAPSSSVTDEPGHPTTTIDRSQVTPVTTNSEGPQLHAQLLSESVGHMIKDAQEWESRTVSRKSSTASSRKASVARRISVDELTKPEKRKSKHSVSLPPSDVSIDDIFTALTHKNPPPSQVEPEKKTFIVTRKQRAQDIDPIDFEKDRPTAPPRTKKTETTVILELSKPDPVVSTASVTMTSEPSTQDAAPIDLDNVFSGKDTLKRRAENTDEDEKIKRRVAEFDMSQQEKLASRMEEKEEKTMTTRRTSWEDSDISMDDVFEKKRVEVVVPIEEKASTQFDPPPPTHTSEATICLDDVFTQGATPLKPKDSDEDEKISRRIDEFQRTEQEKTIEEPSRNVETSEVSMEAVFHAPAHFEETVETRTCEKPAQVPEEPEGLGNVVSSANIYLTEPADKKDSEVVTSSENINLDDVFISGKKPLNSSKEDEEDKKIKRRIAEFQKSQQEKERQTEVEDHSRAVNRTFVESDISIDDVFNTSKTEESEITLESQESKKDPIDLFLPAPDSKVQQSQDDQDKEERILERIVEFKKAQEVVTLQPNESENKNRTSAVNIDLDDVFVTGNAPTSKEDDEEDKKIRRRVAEFEKSQAEKKLQKAGENAPVIRVAQQSFDPSDISMDVVFNVSMNRDESVAEEPAASEVPEDNDVTESETSHQTITMRKETTDVSLDTEVKPKKSEERNQSFTSEDVTSSDSINLDDVFSLGPSGASSSFKVENDEDKKIRQRIAEFQKAQQDKGSRVNKETTMEPTHRILEDSDIPMSDVFNFSSAEKQEHLNDEPTVVITTSEEETTKTDTTTRTETFTETYTKIPGDATSSINMDDVFTSGATGAPKSQTDNSEDKKIRQRIAEFQKAQQDKESRVSKETTMESEHRILEDSEIPLSDVFNFSSTKKNEHPEDSPTMVITTSEEETTKTDTDPRVETSIDTFTRRTDIPGDNVLSLTTINLDDVFKTGTSKAAPESEAETEEDKKIRQRIAEFQKAQQDKESRTGQETTVESRNRILEDSEIPMGDVFNFSSHQEPSSSSEAIVLKTSEEETTKTSTSTSTETTTDTYTRRTGLSDVFTYSKTSAPTLDDLFGPQTPTAIPTVAITSEDPSESHEHSKSTPLTHKTLSSLLVPGKWNDSMMSTTSTISLDDSFNNSLAEPKTRKPLSLPVDSWIDDLVAKTTDEATREAPKTPKSGTYFPSPTRISQEIKYEWVADLAGVQEQSEDPEEHQTDEEHLQKQDSTWVSSVVYRPTLETSAYTLRASQNLELDMDKVFEECLKKKDDEECECTACRLTEQELEEMRKRTIEKKVEEAVGESSSESRKPLEIPNPSQFSIDEIFHPEVPLHIQTGPSHLVPSTSSPPLENSRTYYLSPKVSETVITTHQWKDADISIDEIFSPVSSTNDNRRFSNFYEDRSGWDTIGSEDSGVMSGGDRPRRRSSRTVDRVIDEAFKDIFENQNQPSTSEVKNRDEQPGTETQYDDFYITSLNEGDIEATDSEVDGENLDVTQFVDDILGKSLDEAAFLSSTKSLRDHTDTSIDRKKSADRIHPYYRTRTDTSIDKRSKPEVITEDHEGHDEIMKLVFVDRSMSTSTSRGSLSRASGSGVVKPNDEELLEIEIKPDCFLIKGSYSLLIPKSDPLGQMLQKLRDQNDSLATLDFSLTRKLKKLLVNCIREKAMSPGHSPKYDGLSSRGQSLVESVDHASSTFLRMNADKFEPARNPLGIVNLCTAENNICTPLLEEKFKHLELFFPNTEHLVRYPPSGGWPEARMVLVKYFKEFMSARVTTEELVLTASTRTGYDVVSYCLFEQDDVLLTNGPVYTGTISNVQERALCKVECVPTDLSNPRLEVKKYEEEFNRQAALDNIVSGIIIVNPHNPLGVVFPPEDVVNLCNWAASKNLHVIIDEVFANCVFDKSSSKFRPFLSYRHRVHRPENIAWLWSVSKDFGLPGLKFAVIHSANEGLRKAALKLQLYHPCSPFVQDFTVKLLSDSEWLREFHGEVTRRMAIHYRYTAENLKRLEISFVPAQAGIFVFADFSKHLTSDSQLGELELFERLGSAGVMLTPGVHQKCHVFGWFRLVFACSKQKLEEGFRRLFAQLGSHLQPVGSVLY